MMGGRGSPPILDAANDLVSLLGLLRDLAQGGGDKIVAAIKAAADEAKADLEASKAAIDETKEAHQAFASKLKADAAAVKERAAALDAREREIQQRSGLADKAAKDASQASVQTRAIRAQLEQQLAEATKERDSFAAVHANRMRDLEEEHGRRVQEYERSKAAADKDFAHRSSLLAQAEAELARARVALNDRDAGVGKREAAVAEAEKALASAKEEHDRKIADLRAKLAVVG